MPNPTLTIAYFQDAVATLLGTCGVEIELSADTYKSLLRQTILLLTRSRPCRHQFTVPVSNSQKKYGPYNHTTHPGFKGVVAVQFVSDTVADRVDPFDTFNNIRSQTLQVADGSTFGDIDLQLTSRKQARAIASTETEWKGQWERDGNYYLYISTGGQTLQCSVTYTWNMTADDDPATGLRWVDADDVGWVIEYGTALAKQVLSRVRGKHQGVIGPDGNVLSLDHIELASEGREDAERLRIEIENRRRPLSPIIG